MPVLQVTSPKGLTEQTTKELVSRLTKAVKVLGKAVRPAIDAWVWALQHGFEGYRPTCKQAGVEPSGHLQKCYEVARAMVECETTLDDITEAAAGDRLEDLANAARQMLREQGLIAAKGKARTALETAAKVVDSIVKIVENLDKPVSTRAKSNAGIPKPLDVPAFNVRDAVLAALSGKQVNIVLLTDIPPQVVPLMVEAGAQIGVPVKS